MVKMIRLFCCHQNFVPWGCLPLPWGYIHVLNHEKNCIISDFEDIFLKLATNEWSDKTFLLTSKLCPLGLSVPTPGLYTFKKSWKKLYKIRLQRDFFETCNKWPKWQDFPVDIKFHPQGVVSPCPGAIYIYKMMKKKMHKIRLQRFFWNL